MVRIQTGRTRVPVPDFSKQHCINYACRGVPSRRSHLQYHPICTAIFQAVYLESPLKSAISILPLCCSSVGFGILSAVAVGLCALWDRSSSLAAKATFQVILGIGTGTLFSILIIPMQASAPHVDDMGLAAGILVSFRLFGGLVGLAMCSAVFNNVFKQRITSLGPLPGAVAILNDVREAVGFIPLLRDMDLPPQLLGSFVEAYRKSTFAVFLMLAGVAVVGFLISFFIKEITLENEQLGRQQFQTSE